MNRNFLFIIEGADKCGKSYLCKHLIEKYKCNYIHNGKYRIDPFRNYGFQLELLKNIEGHPHLILDRYILSNYVYSHVFQDNEAPLPREFFKAYKDHVNRIARAHGYIPVWIVCAPNRSVWEQTFNDSVAKGEELYTDMEKMTAVYDMMAKMAIEEDMTLFDWTQDSDYNQLEAYLDDLAGKFDVVCRNDFYRFEDHNENTMQIADLFSYFRMLKDSGEPMVNGTYEVLNHQFVMDPCCDIEFPGYKVNREYHEKELKWYLSLDRSITGWMDGVKIWENVASKDGKREINSNYGWCAFSVENGSQYSHVVKALELDPNTRQAQFIYTRPEMHNDWNKDGRHDFICTNTIQVFIRDNQLFYKIDQRSLDTTTGLRADWYWHMFVYRKLMVDLQQFYPDLKPGKVLWNVGSCHIYERSFGVLDKITDMM